MAAWKHKSAKRSVQLAERQVEAMRLVTGGMSIEDAAFACGVAKMTVYQWSLKARRKAAMEVSEAIRPSVELELYNIQELWDVWFPKALAGDDEAFDKVMTLLDRRAKYCGLYAPTKVDGTLHHSGSIQHQHLTREQMQEEIRERLRKLEDQKNRLAAIEVVPSEN